MGIKVGDVLGGDVRLDAEVGSGGFAVVYRGLQIRLDRRVAVKVLKLHTLPNPDEAWQLFEREGILLGRLRDPHIVDVFTMGVHEGVPYIVMEWLNGVSLDKKLERDGVFSEERALQVVEQAARGLGKAHDRSLVHRDIKPENLFEMTDGTIKLIDFGLGRRFGLSEVGTLRGLSDGTVAGMVRGTPRFMSPEQAGGGLVDHRTDIYSLGVVLYNLLTGRTPFGHYEIETDESLVEYIASGRYQPEDVLTYRPDVSGDVQALIRKATAADPSDRLQSANEFERAARTILVDRAGSRTRRNTTPPQLSLSRGSRGSVAESFRPTNVTEAPEPLARGTVFLGLREGTAAIFGARGLAEIGARLPTDARDQTIDGLVFAGSWLPERYVLAWFEAAWDLAAGQSATFNEFVDRMIDGGFGKVRRVTLTHFAGPSVLLEDAPKYWRHDHSHGELSSGVDGERSGWLRLAHHPYVTSTVGRRAVAEMFRYSISLARAEAVKQDYSLVNGTTLQIKVSWQ